MKPAQLANQIKETLLHSKTTLLNIIIKGGPGIGKSELMASIAKLLGWDLIVMHPQISDPTKFEGLPWINEKKNSATLLPFSDLKKMIDAKEDTLVFMDDMIQAAPAVQAAVMQLIQARRVNGHKISPLVHFVAATNRETDKAGGNMLIEPLKSRYIIWNMDPDVNDWCNWAQKPENGVPAALVAFIRMKPGMLYQFEPSKKIENYPCPRTIYNLGLIMQTDIPVGLEMEVYEGLVGREFAAEFKAFMSIRKSLPHPDTVLSDPMNAIIPNEVNTLYALCSMLSERAVDPEKIDGIVAYARRLSDKEEFKDTKVAKNEFSIFLIKSAISINEEVQNAKGFIEWADENQSLLFYE